LASLNVWMNGELVGEWTTSRTGTPLFRYVETWPRSPRARALSLSLPITADLIVRGAVVDNYFDNLLPDNPDIRRRIRTRFAARSTEPFDLLQAIGRDCVGAVQLLPPDETPLGWDRVTTTPLTKAALERVLQSVAAPPVPGHQEGADDENEDFRISIAGAQEKTALLSMGGAWFRPRGATPTTHILKLPLRIVGDFQGDLSDSVENEWLCSQLLQKFGLPVAETSILRVGQQTALSVRRFDRRWIGVEEVKVTESGFKPPKKAWVARLPQEDFCQVTGRPPTQRYEAEGGPSIEDILEILAGSDAPDIDRANFALAQLACWLLAATAGHAKNFSIQSRAGGAFRMTPLYDVLSAWPIIGRGARHIPVQDVKLAMAISGRTRHYRLTEVQPRHWRLLASRAGSSGLWEKMQEMAAMAGPRIESVRDQLPARFPERVMDSVEKGVRRQSAVFLSGTALPRK
jgi:serine/threonine-protein kinase HipA